jgi:MOSC domain-containing protein YiiM
MGDVQKTARVISINTSPKKTMRKAPQECATLILDRGIEGDAHLGDWHRQISMLAIESIDKMREKGLDVGPGDFAENLTTEGIDLMELPIGTKVRVGDAELELSQIGKICHTKCAIYYQAGDCVMPREGIFFVVRKPADIAVGDEVEVLGMGDGTCEANYQEVHPE